jgi:protoporphyrinogen oxidase
MLWEKFEDYLNANSVEVKKNSYVIGVEEENGKQIVKYTNNGDEKIVSAEHVLFSNPLLDFIKFYKKSVRKRLLYLLVILNIEII